jgi:hypothetical protein
MSPSVSTALLGINGQHLETERERNKMRSTFPRHTFVLESQKIKEENDKK